MLMDNYKATLRQNGFEGDIDDSPESKDKFSHDASFFEIVPQLVVAPRHEQDIERLVQTTQELRASLPGLSLTARSAGTCMSGGSINDSIVIDYTKYMNTVIDVTSTSARSQTGVYYRDFEKRTLAQGVIMPSFPASRELCAIGGMVGNHAGGELSLRYGKIDKFVTSLRVTLADGNTYNFEPINREQLDVKMSQDNFEGTVYRDIYNLIETNYDMIKAAKPRVSKNSTGYNLWDVWDRETGIFDMTKLFIGSQGTLGLMNEVNFRLIKEERYSGVLVAFMRSIDNLGEVINEVVARRPTSFESFDNYTLNLSVKFFFYFRKTLGWGGLIKLGLSLIPDALILMRGIPKMILLIEFTGDTQHEVDTKIAAMHQALKKYKLEALEDDETPQKAWKFRIMRRESFNLLRKKVADKHTAPYIDDLVVPPEHLVEFLPELRRILNNYKLLATVAGHMGDGNFHVIPLMKFEDPKERAKIQPSMKEVNDLVLKYGGSLSGEHNDGLIRGPWLEQMYGKEMTDIFKQTKRIFDANNIFNPHKKTDATWEYSMAHIREHF